jgi:hypothetical protein
LEHNEAWLITLCKEHWIRGLFVKKLYSQMSYIELEKEMHDILNEMIKVEFTSQKELLERKYYMAKSYTLRPADFEPGLYLIQGYQDEKFELLYVNGIMGWGNFGSEREVSFPLSMLISLNNIHD